MDLPKISDNVHNIPLGSSYLDAIASIVTEHDDIDIIILPNNRSCYALKKTLLRHPVIIPKMVAISDLLCVPDITTNIVKFLQNMMPNIPFLSVYNLSCSLFDLTETILLHKSELSSICVPDTLYKSWHHTLVLLRELEQQPFFIHMKKLFHVKQLRQFEVLSQSKLLIAGISNMDYYTGQIIELAQQRGVVVVEGREVAKSYNCKRFSYDRNDEAETMIQSPLLLPAKSSNILLEFDNQDDESEGIAILVRKYLHENQSVMIICPEEKLSLKVQFELMRWNIEVNKSSGKHFDQSFAGQVFRAVCSMLQNNFDNCSVFNFLKYISSIKSDLFNFEIFLRRQNRYSYNFLQLLDQFCLANSLQTVKNDLNVHVVGQISQNDEMHTSGRFNGHKARLNESKIFQYSKFDKYSDHQPLNDVLMLLKNLILKVKSQDSISGWIHYVCELVQLVDTSLVTEIQFAVKTWDSERDIILSLEDFCNFFTQCVLKMSVVESTSERCKVNLLGILESQFIEADQIIICGANEESWTVSSVNDFWLGPAMLRHLGIDTKNKMQLVYNSTLEHFAFGSSTVITRSKKKDNKDMAIHYLFSNIQPAKDHECLQILSALRHFKKEKASNRTIVGNPPLSARPRRLWVSDLDLLQTNPYAFYAKKILRLKDLPALNQISNIKGNLMHDVLEKFVSQLSFNNISVSIKDVFNQVLEKYSNCLEHQDLWLFAVSCGELYSFVENFLNNTSMYYTEIEGNTIWRLTNNGEFCDITLSCRADMIEIDSNDNLHIVDYKTGLSPSKIAVRSGEKPQLLIEALIAQYDGFGIHKTDVDYLGFLQLKPKELKLVEISTSKDDTNTLVNNLRNQLYDLLRQYNLEGKIYEVNGQDLYNDAFMHLARVKENLIA
ncbi:MAG: hypothetical protein E7015_02735 [Alphaproteobacteria bacterium]|nr:hypothetical protein [Alphaproteobacteria bacterium]